MKKHRDIIGARVRVWDWMRSRVATGVVLESRVWASLHGPNMATDCFLVRIKTPNGVAAYRWAERYQMEVLQWGGK